MKLFSRFIGFFFLTLLGISLLNSCEKGTDDCFQPTTVLARISFTTVVPTHIDTLIDSIFVDTVVIRSRDTFFPSPVAFSLGMPQNIKVLGTPQDNFIGMPLAPDSNRIRYVLQYDTLTSLKDTIEYFYSTSVHFISNACGFTNYYHIDSVHTTNHLIDSLSLTKRDVTLTASDRHLQLYFFKH